MTKPPLKWHGGKHYLVKHILPRIPKHTHYVEPFFGSGAIFFAKPEKLIEGYSEVINDLHKDLTCFYVVIRNKKTFLQFQQRIELTPFSELEWQASEEDHRGTAVEKAIRFFIRYRQSRQGIGRSFATLSKNRTRRGMNEQVSSWLKSIEGLEEVHDRLRRVVVLNQHAVDVIISEDGPNTFFYLDPPYIAESRTAKNVYEHEMSRKDHAQLLESLCNIDGKFLLSGYSDSLYDHYAMKNGWVCEYVDVPNAASNQQVKEIKTECLWRNY